MKKPISLSKTQHKTAFFGSSNISSVYNKIYLQKIFRDLFALAYNKVLSDMYSTLLIRDTNEIDKLIKEETNSRYYPIKFITYSLSKITDDTTKVYKNKKEMDEAMIDDAKCVIFIRINDDKEITKNIEYAKKINKRVILLDL